MNEKEINRIIIRSLSGEADEQEKIILQSWLKSSRQNSELYARIEKAWNSVQTPQPDYVPDFENFWEKLSARIRAEEVTDSPYKAKNKSVPFFERIKARLLQPSFALPSLIAVIIAGILIYLTFSNNTVNVYKAERGKQIAVNLPDGSYVKLNSESEITYKETSGARFVEILGEGFFAVKKDGRSFAVKTFNAVTSVTGTRFNVKSRGNATTIIVEEGSVRVQSTTHANEAVVLNKDEMSICIDELAPTEPIGVNTSRLIGWVDKKLVFEGTPLKEIAEELSRYYNKDVVADENIKKETLTGEFKEQSLNDILEAICLSLNLRYREESDRYILYR